MNETWIVFKAESLSAHGWEERKLLPSGGLTDILATEWDFSGKLPQVGDRVREYANLQDPGNGVTHGRDGVGGSKPPRTYLVPRLRGLIPAVRAIFVLFPYAEEPPCLHGGSRR